MVGDQIVRKTEYFWSKILCEPFWGESDPALGIGRVPVGMGKRTQEESVDSDSIRR
jgi:hypothetical protein